MRRPSAALILIISLFMAVPAIAGPMEDAEKTYKQGDYKTAYRLIKPLAEQGSPKAQTRLGILYFKGQGVPQDYAEAAKWYRKAADQGIDGAQFSLGVMYFAGKGVPQDFAEAARWLRKAADQGFSGAQAFLGYLYSSGQGVPQDYVLAHMWLNLAIPRLPPTTESFDKLPIATRDEVASMMTPAQIAEAQKLAREWKPKKEK
jgi:hypothetical protein